LESRIANAGYVAFLALMSSPWSAALASGPVEPLAKDTVQQKSLLVPQGRIDSQPDFVASSAGIQSASERSKVDPIRPGPDPLDFQPIEQRLAKEQSSDRDLPSFKSLFGIPLRGADYKPTRQIRCDALRHLKTPSTYRRLDSFSRPEVVLPQAKESDFVHRDYMTGDWGRVRTDLYKAGVDVYACLGFDNLNVLQGNLSSTPAVRSAPPNVTDQQNYVQLYGLDFYSELVNKEWEGGQLHFSFAWPESKPIWLFGNALTPIDTQSVHGNFYYDVGTARDSGGTANSA